MLRLKQDFMSLVYNNNKGNKKIMKRERYIPENSQEHVVGEMTYYTFVTETGNYAWIAYRRKQSKSFFRRAYRTEQQRQVDIDMYVREAERTIKETMERKLVTNPYKEGDILYSSWGYDQTNIDFYKVLEVKAKSVVIAEISQETISGSQMEMSARVMPRPERVVGQPMLKRVADAQGNVRLTSYSHARTWDGTPKTATYYA